MTTNSPNENKAYTLPDFLAESIGKGIRKARKEKSVTQEELAQKLNMSEQEVEKLERGETPITITEADKIAAALGTTTEELVKQGEGFHIGGAVTDSNVLGNNAYHNADSNYNGISEAAFNNLTVALNRICDMLEKKL